MDPIYFGIFGGTIFIIAWIYETWEEIHKHKMFTDLKFAYMNFVGIVFMITYSYINNVQLFLYLNSILLFFVGFEIAYSKYLQHKYKKSRKK